MVWLQSALFIFFSFKSIMQAHSGEDDQRNFILLEIPSQFMGNMSFTFVPSAPGPWVCLSKYWFAPNYRL